MMRYINLHLLTYTTLGKMSDASKVLNPQHFGSNPADIQIQVWINAEIRIRIPDHLRLRLDASRFVLSDLSTV